MALTKDQKKKAIDNLEQQIKDKKSVVFVDFAKVNSKDIFAFRKKLKESGCKLKVSKKTLLGIAFGKDNAAIWEEAKKNIPGQLAVVFGVKDGISPARVSAQFTKQSENIKILGGIFENKFADKETVFIYSAIPTREELLSKLVGSLASPISGFENVLQGNIKGLLYALSAIKK